MHKLQNTAGRQKLIFIVIQIQIIWQLPRLHRRRHLKLDFGLQRSAAPRTVIMIDWQTIPV